MISVIIPTFNAPTLERALRSSLRQAAVVNEIIVVDDGSQPPQQERVASELRNDTHVRWLYQSNAGPSVARNIGADLASGPYLAFLDDDDVLNETWGDVMTELITSRPALASCGSRITSVTDNQTAELVALPRPLGAVYHDRNGYFAAGSYVVLKSVFQAVSGFDPNCLYGEHHELAIRLVDHIHRRGLAIASTTRVGVNRHSIRTSDVVSRYAKARAIGAEYTVRKHKALFAWDPAAKATRLGVAGVAYAQLGDLRNARRLLWEAARTKPGYRTFARAFLATFSPLARRFWRREGAEERK